VNIIGNGVRSGSRSIEAGEPGYRGHPPFGKAVASCTGTLTLRKQRYTVCLFAYTVDAGLPRTLAARSAIWSTVTYFTAESAVASTQPSLRKRPLHMS
jgi:hypothetical protein